MTTQSIIRETLESGRTREVAAMITFARLPKIKQDFSNTVDVAGMLQKIGAGQPFMLRRAWFGYDTFAHDLDIAGKQIQISIAERTAAEIYETLGVNPSAAINKARAQNISDDDVRAALEEPALSFIDLDLRKGAPTETIQTQVPFARLKRFLSLAFKMTEKGGRAQMLNVRIAHAPRLNNGVAKVRELLAMDFADVEIDPRIAEAAALHMDG